MAERHDPDDFADAVGDKAKRKLAARGAGDGVWSWLGMFGLVGWSVAVPTVLGVLLGWWLDRRWPQGFSWTLTMLIAGLVLGCVNAWYWVRQESSRD